ncbi:type IV toxin-antitoxin system AbiEi family antitoxin domain-containing protein, partial [Arthrobacter globiformis]|uniref:type IV toxin-antitoxin system AbiEi family antitoxin domain-containing protein n=1 Tax=Arthrobacter globiformis TaxID=1665 RepID=UPI0011250E21
MDLELFLARRGGVARRSDILRAGFQRIQLDASVAAGRLYRPQRGVYAVVTADRDLLAAFRANGQLTCVSAARFYGLWVLHPPQALHLSCGNGVPKQGVIDHGACVHEATLACPVAALADVLLHALRCLPELEALVMVQSATGTGQIS